MTGNGTGLGKQYMSFVRANMDQVAKKITDDLWVLSAMEVLHFMRNSLPDRPTESVPPLSALVHRTSTGALHMAHRPA